MQLRLLLLNDFGIDFPISGGTGGSKDNPIVVHRREPNDYVGIERGVLKCIAKGRGCAIEFKHQALLKYHGRQLDQLKVHLTQRGETETEHFIENYYFDITECIGDAALDRPASDKAIDPESEIADSSDIDAGQIDELMVAMSIWKSAIDVGQSPALAADMLYHAETDETLGWDSPFYSNVIDFCDVLTFATKNRALTDAEILVLSVRAKGLGLDVSKSVRLRDLQESFKKPKKWWQLWK